MSKLSVAEIRVRKKEGSLVVLTCYDYQTARILDESDVDVVLVGDSLGMVFQGRSDTHAVTMEQMCYHAEIVRRGAPDKHIVVDMPIRSFEDAETALANAARLLSLGADAVKIEGCDAEVVEAFRERGIALMGHLGLLPQTALAYRVVGKKADEVEALKRDAERLVQGGAYSLVLECVPESVAADLTRSIPVPVIGIGAGRHCDGQVLVINDMLGLSPDRMSKFVKRYADGHGVIRSAVETYAREIRDGLYPDDAHTYH